MLKAFWLVLLDLWDFILHPPAALLAINGSHTKPSTLALPPAANPIPPLLTETIHSDASAVSDRIHPGTVAYISSRTAELMRSPYLEYDGRLMTVQYGDAVQIHSYSGRYARVLVRGREGWILKDSLTHERAAVWPQLYEGNRYFADTPATVAIRYHVADAFFCAALLLPLQATEYVMYRLVQDRRVIVWPNERPRLAGEWQRILRGCTGIHIGVRPLAGALIEYRDAGEGVLGFVESVAPDESIVVSAVGRDEVGVYTSTLYTADQWREFRPVFIEVV